MTMIDPSLRPMLAILASLLAIPLIFATSDRRNLREAVTVVAALTKFGLIASLVPAVVWGGQTYEFSLFTLASGIELALKVDALGLL